MFTSTKTIVEFIPATSVRVLNTDRTFRIGDTAMFMSAQGVVETINARNVILRIGKGVRMLSAQEFVTYNS